MSPEAHFPCTQWHHSTLELCFKLLTLLHYLHYVTAATFFYCSYSFHFVLLLASVLISLTHLPTPETSCFLSQKSTSDFSLNTSTLFCICYQLATTMKSINLNQRSVFTHTHFVTATFQPSSCLLSEDSSVCVSTRLLLNCLVEKH